MGDNTLELSSRLEDTREKKISRIIKFELDEIKFHFIEDISAIREQFNVYDKLIKEENHKCAELILRSQIVLLVSAFDFYLHEITNFGVNKIFEGD